MKKYLKIVVSVLLTCCIAILMIGCSAENNPTTSEISIKTAISLNKSTLELSVGETEKLSVTLKTTNFFNNMLFGYTLSFDSSAPEIASVDANGIVTAFKEGTATITATYTSKTKTATATCEVTVSPAGQNPSGPTDPKDPTDPTNPNPPTMELTPTLSLIGGYDPNETIVIPQHESYMFIPVVYYDGKECTDAQFEYSSDDTGVASVSDDGVIAAVGADGQTANITVKASWGGKNANNTPAMAITIPVQIAAGN